MSIMGTRVVRVEDPRLLTSGATYTEDLRNDRLVGALHATLVRSPLAHARILSVDTAEALAAPGVVAVLTAGDLGRPPLPPMMPIFSAAMTTPLLASEVVRFVGDPVAVVLTEQAYQGQDAADLVVVDDDALPAVVDLRAAAADEVLLFPEETGIPMERISVRYGDTDLVPDGMGTMGSRSLQQGGAAVRQATQELVELARRRAAELLEAGLDDIVVDKDRAAVHVAGSPDAVLTFGQLAESEPLQVRSVFEAPGPTFPFGAHVAVVEVDVQTGRVRLRRLVAVDDAGTILNPLLAEGQRHGGYAQGAAQALMEEFRYDADGNPETSNLATYPFLSATEVPSFETVPMATATPYNQLGAKGVGEAGTIGATPAVHDAVVDAVSHLGVRHLDMPTTPQPVFRSIQQAQSGVSR